MSMDFQTNLREIYGSNPLHSSQENYMMKSRMKEIDLPFGVPSSSQQGLFLQDFHHMDQFHHYNNGGGSGSSSNNQQIFGVQNLHTIDPFGTNSNFTYGSASTCFDVFESKPFVENNINNAHVMDNFQYGGGGYGLNLPHQRNQLDIMVPNQSYFPFNVHQEITNKPVNFVVPDEVSCISPMNYYNKKVAINKMSRTSSSYPTSRRAFKIKKKSNIVKGQWTESEDSLLIQLVEQYGLRKWSHIAQMLPGRIGKQCRERWHNHLRPDIKKDVWNEEEDRILIEAHAEIGNKWAEIAKRLPGRTENSIKNHWNATKRRQYSKRKCRTKYPRGSILQEYIKSLNLDKNPPIDYRRRSVNPRGRMKSKINTSNSTSKVVFSSPPPLLQSSKEDENDQFVPNDNRSVPDFDFNEVPDFCFDDNFFEEGCSIDSFLDEFHCVPVPTMDDDGEKELLFDGKLMKQIGGNINVEGTKFDNVVDLDENDFDTNMSNEIMESMLGAEVKKEMDLVEMISHINNNVNV